MAISDGERQLLTYLNSLYQEGARFREKVSQDWQRAIKVYKGKIWPENRPSYKVNATMNFLAQIVERKTALLTDTKPIASVTSRHKGGILDPVCEILTKTIDAILSEINWERKLTELIFLEQLFGLAGLNTCYNQETTDIDIVVLDPRSFIFDPFVVRSWDLNAGEYFCFETVRPTDYLRDKYASRADDIKPDFSSAPSSDSSFLSRLYQTFSSFFSHDNQPFSVVPRSIVRHFWLRDRRTKKDGKLVFPNWRCITVAGGCVVEDGANPYIDGNLPFDLMEWDFNVDSAYGFNEVSKLEMPQKMFNKVLATAIENIILMGNAIWIGDYNALTPEEWERLSNEPGTFIRKRPGSDLRREPGVPLPPFTINLLSILSTGLEKLSSITEVTEGRRPGQVTSGVGIEALQLAANTVIRLKARQIENLIERVGQKLISRIFQYYTEDRVFSIVGDGQRFEKFIFEREKIRNALVNANISPTVAFRDFIFKVVPTSSLALTKWQKGLMAVQLYQLGAIDREALLEAVEFPNREEILARTIERQQLGIEPMGVRKGQKLPRTMLRAGHQETPIQLPQVGGKR
ncbi:MAG: hypothetical protein QXQ53_04825 [Candidatus Methanosuratincola sp.]